MFFPKKTIRYLILAFLLGAFFLTSYAIYYFLDYKREERERWNQVSYEFKSCNMFYALRKMGYSDTPLDDAYTYNSLPDSYAQLRQPLVELLTTDVKNGRITGLEQIWLDPNSVGAIGSSRLSEASLNFYHQCKESIDRGNKNLWLDIGIYYLLIGNSERAIEWLENAGKGKVPDAFVLLGHAYKNGLLTGQNDHKTAMAHYRRAADLGSVKGKIYFAEMIEEEDPASSISYLESAVAQGSLSSAYRLARFNPPRIESKSYGSQDRYFWALVFQGLYNHWLSKPFDQRLDNLQDSPALKESSIEYSLDGIPNRAWTGYGSRFIEVNKVRRYEVDDIEDFLRSREGALTLHQRVEAQGKAAGWLQDFRKRTGAGN
jgi:tetratricopeptide (TPR) repeat protein